MREVFQLSVVKYGFFENKRSLQLSVMGLESTTARDLLLVQQSCLQEAMTQERELQPKNEKPVIRLNRMN